MTKIQLKNIVKEALSSLKEQSQVFPPACADSVVYYYAQQGMTQVPLTNPQYIANSSYVQDALAACCNNLSDPDCMLIAQNNCCNYVDVCVEFGNTPLTNQNQCCERCQNVAQPIQPSDDCYPYCDCCDPSSSPGVTDCSSLPGYGTSMADSCCEKCASQSVIPGVGDPCEAYCDAPQCCGQSPSTSAGLSGTPVAQPSTKEKLPAKPTTASTPNAQLVKRMQERAGIKK